MKYGYKWVTGFGIAILALCLILVFIAVVPTAKAQGSRPSGWWVNGDAGNGWQVNGVWPYIYINGYGESNAWFYAYTYMRWPGNNDGVSKSIWFRTGLDDNHWLYINGNLVTYGPCCSYAYGAYSAKPGDIVKIEFYSNNTGGNDWIFRVDWDPDGNGNYSLLSNSDVSYVDSTYGGGSGWYSSSETQAQINQKSLDRARLAALAQSNKIYITQSGSYSEVDVIQEGSTNYIQGRGGIGDAVLQGDFNTLRIRQGDGLGGGKNLIEFNVNGTGNTITLQQGWNGTWPAVTKDGVESGGHFMDLKVAGNTNTVTLKQTNAGGANSGHYNRTEVTGNTNTVTVNQAFGLNTYHSFYSTITGNSNYVNVNQAAAGSQYMDLILAGSGHTVTATQTGNGSHKATISLTNAGGASTLNLIQQGSINQQYNITQACANLSGCSVTVTQGTP